MAVGNEYTSGGVSLDDIFLAGDNFSQIPLTKYVVSDGLDLRRHFVKWTSDPKAPLTGFTVNGTDLNQIFQYIDTVPGVTYTYPSNPSSVAVATFSQLTFGDAVVTFRLVNDGSLSGTEAYDTGNPTDYATPTAVQTGTDHHFKYSSPVDVGGTTFSPVGTVPDTWYPLSSDRLFSLTVTDDGVNSITGTSNFDVSISRDAGVTVATVLNVQLTGTVGVNQP